MTRGIHLKRLKSADLHAIGVDDGIGDDEHEGPSGRLAEVDPVLSQALEEVRRELEATRGFLDEALENIRHD